MVTFPVRLSENDVTYTERLVGKRASKIKENFELKRIGVGERESLPPKLEQVR